ncbi:cytochrome o ubiquinol oxidase subunit IV [Methylobacterium sp. J-077]|nr:cytochrome o ubiquinol oxidase subunit IV [Methylobacterium sp. J-077]MCJ2124957.1 cytochrome o ubiquinol oxidase subunit IV [Methylobacterium sp. J-077]
MEGADVWSSVRTYLIGLALAAMLTAGSFWISSTGVIYGPGVPVALIVFALAQIGVHLVFFLHLTTAPDNVNNAMALAFGVLVVVLLIGGTLWIMMHMNANMMPMGAAHGPHMHGGHP